MLQLYRNIKARRNELGMTQDELAKKLGYKDRSAIAKIESGNSDLPVSKIKAFAIALETSASELMGDTENINEKIGYIVESELLNDSNNLYTLLYSYSKMDESTKELFVSLAEKYAKN